MAFAETANLAVKLTLGGNFTSQMAKARGSLRSFDRESRGFKAGAQIGTGIRNSAILAVAALGTLTGALAVAVKMGQEAAKTQEIYAQAIKNSGRVTAVDVKALKAQQTALMNLGGVDDELIKSEQTRLILMGLSGKATAKLTPLILDAAKATGKDLLTVTIAAGKAANGNAGALQRLGIQVDKVRFKANPLAETIRVLNKRFGGTTAALSGDFSTRMAALKENLNNIAEDVGIKLLPSLTRIVDTVGTKLVPAFGKFVDRILPDITSGLNSFADALANGGAENAIKGITDALGPMIDLVKIAAKPVQEIVKAFLSLPKEVQTVLVGAFAVNKLTGGLVTNAAGGIIEAIGKGLLGGIKAPLVNVQGGVVNVGGGIPGGGGAPVAVASKGLGLLSKVFLVGEAIGLVAAVNDIRSGIEAATTEQAKTISAQTTKYIASQPSTAALATSLAGIDAGIAKLQADPIGTALIGGKALEELKGMRRAVLTALSQRNPHAESLAHRALGATLPTGGPHDESLAHRALAATTTATEKVQASVDATRGKLNDDLAAGTAATTAAGSKTAGATVLGGFLVAGATRQGSANIVGAIRASAPKITTNVTVNVTAGGITKTVTVAKRYGPVGGSRIVGSRGSVAEFG